jgi:methyltransferase (TIGR00027 family)
MMEKVRLTREKETMLATLYGRAMESARPDALLRDPMAEQAVGRIEYDFGRLGVKPHMGTSVAMRARLIDARAAAFLAAHPECTVLHLACGLDSRVFRLDPPAGVRWYDVDFPEVIALRRRLYPERPGCHLVASSVLEPGWLERVDAGLPTLLVAEGLLMYLTEADVRTLLGRVTGRFPSGEMVFDVVSRLGVRLQKLNPPVRASGATHHFGLEDPHDLERWVPRLHLAERLDAFDMTADWPRNRPMPASLRIGLPMFRLIPLIRRMGLLLRYTF